MNSVRDKKTIDQATWILGLRTTKNRELKTQTVNQ